MFGLGAMTLYDVWDAHLGKITFDSAFILSNIPYMFLTPIIFYNLNSYCSDLLELKNLHGQVRKASCFKNCLDLSLFEEIV